MTPSDSQKCRDLLQVLEISRMMAATADPDGLLQLIIDRSMHLLNAERASLFVYDPDSNELVSRIAVGTGEIRFPADQGIAGATAQSGETIVVPDAYEDERFNPDIDRKTGFRTRNILSVPLQDHEGKLVGVLQVINKQGGASEPYDIALAETLGAQAGVAMQRARLIHHYVEKQKMERAMMIARDIQRSLLPAKPLSAAGFDVAGFSEPADDTGGDTYDFLALPDGRWMLGVADASGHGIGPALVIAETRAILRAITLQGLDVATVLRLTNDLLSRDLEGRFVTCFLGLLNPDQSAMTYASAGHGPLVFYDRSADEFSQYRATALPLGIVSDCLESESATYQFESGDFAAITTDGIFEAEDPDGEPFGIPRMMDILHRDRDLPAKTMIQNLHQSVTDFCEGAPQADDLTAVIIRKM
jgi:phosphoserine phosphatase RsbU/P